MNKKEYLLTCLIEECAEVQKEATKALRFGLDDKWEHDTTPAERLYVEMCDILGVLETLMDEGILGNGQMSKQYSTPVLIELKKKKIKRWMQYAVERKTLDLEEESYVELWDDEFEFKVNGISSGQYAKGKVIDRYDDGSCLVELFCNGVRCRVKESILRYKINGSTIRRKER